MKAKTLLTVIIFMMIFPILTFSQSKKVPREFKNLMEKYENVGDSKQGSFNRNEIAIIAYYEETGNFPDIKKQEKLIEKFNKKYNNLRYDVREMKRQEIMKVLPTLTSLQDQILECNKYDVRLYEIASTVHSFNGNFWYDFTKKAVGQNYWFKNRTKVPENALQDNELETIITYYEDRCDKFYETFGSYESKSTLLKSFYIENMIIAFESQIKFYNGLKLQKRANNMVLKLVLQHPDLLMPIVDDNAPIDSYRRWRNSDLIEELITLYNETGKFEQSHKLLITLLNDSKVAEKGTFYDYGFNGLYNKVSYILKDASSVDSYIFKNQDNLPLRYGDYSESAELLPVVNLSSQVLYSSVNFLSENNLNNAFPTFIGEGLKKGKLWPSYSGLTYTNTPTLNKILTQQPDIVLLLENSYLPNIIHYQIVNGTTKVYFLADKKNNIVAVFDLPKSASAFKRIPVNYYSMSRPSESTGYFPTTKSSTGLYGYSMKKVEESSLKDLQLNPFLICDKVYAIKLEKERQELEKIRQEQIARDKRLQEERIVLEKLQEEKRKEEEQRQKELQECAYKVTEPKAPIRYIDNRSLCCCCNRRYAMHRNVKQQNTELKKTEHLCLLLARHVVNNNLSADFYACGIGKIKDYIDSKNYKHVFTTGLVFMGSGYLGMYKMGLMGDNYMKEMAVNIYEITSQYCSLECQNKCYCQ